MSYVWWNRPGALGVTVDVRESLNQMLSLKISELESALTLTVALLQEEREGGSRRCIGPNCSNIISWIRLRADHSTCSTRCEGRLPGVQAERRLRRAQAERMRALRPEWQRVKAQEAAS